MEIRLEDNSDEVNKALEQAVEKSLEECDLLAEGYAKTLCQVDTGLLRNSVTHARSGASFQHDYKADRGDAQGSVGGTIGSEDEKAMYIGTNVEYAPYVEMGTIKTAKHPFLQPAVEDHADTYQAVFEKNLKEFLG
ncbi:MAG: HK97 gp10 family phage protein [Eubacterium sp.]|nr:HK97 gp10 family phage protein [Eubacterium sp.]